MVRGFADEQQIVDHRYLQRAVEVPHGAIHARRGAGRAKIRFAQTSIMRLRHQEILACACGKEVLGAFIDES